MSNLLTIQGADGRHVDGVQPVANSVTGSPFTTGAAAVATPALNGLVLIRAIGNAIHLRVDKEADTADADGNDFYLPAGELVRIPCDNHIISMLQETGAATVYVELSREVTP